MVQLLTGSTGSSELGGRGFVRDYPPLSLFDQTSELHDLTKIIDVAQLSAALISYQSRVDRNGTDFDKWRGYIRGGINAPKVSIPLEGKVPLFVR